MRNGYLPERTVQTGIGDVTVQVPKVRDRSGAGIKFHSGLLPPYLKRSQSIQQLLPWLYLKSCGSRQTTLSMVYKLLETAQKHWNRISGFRWLPLVANDSPFKNGELVEDEADGSEEEGAA